jgi:xyloglucan fucosyltransferase
MHQPSYEGWQKWADKTHNERALGEMYLLSTCDVLVTTGFFTYGYVAQWLDGVRPWIMPATPMDG